MNEILQRLEPTLGPLVGEPQPLAGGITNRNFRVRFGDGGEYVVRVHGENTGLLGIDRRAERIASEMAAELGIGPTVAAALDGCLVTRFIACDPLGEGEVGERAADIARALRAFHDSGLQLPSTFDVPALLAGYLAELGERGVAPPARYGEALDAAVRAAAALPREEPRPCHNDLLPGNVIRAAQDGSVMLVDWEYAGMGHPYFDLGNVSVNNDFTDADDERLLAAYHGEQPSPAHLAALKLARVLSDAREAAWGALQEAISELDFDFHGYAQAHFDRLGEAVERGAFEEWLATAAG